MDRQDDNAASRLFSAGTLEYICENHAEYMAEIVYLFVFGELIDAYQNRSIPHSERVQMVLRARYFLDGWETYLSHAQLSTKSYFLSREVADISRIIIDGYLSLMIIHHDYLDEPFPLLPWLHSTEACEHIFGEARRLVKDFCMLDFIYMVPKLCFSVQRAIVHAKGADAHLRANGYNHTYVDASGADLRVLSVFPDDAQIVEISKVARGEADSLMELLGLQLRVLNHLRGFKAPNQVELPGVETLVAAARAGHPESADLSDDEHFDSESDSDIELCENAEMEKVIHEMEAMRWDGNLSDSQERRLLALASGALSLTFDEMTRV